MYTLYYSPNACSLATLTLLNMLEQTSELKHVQYCEKFQSINPFQAVPVLECEGQYYTEGAAIILYLLAKHPSDLFTNKGEIEHQTLQNIMMANASIHPAYSRLFFLEANAQDGEIKTSLMEAAANAISSQWQVIESKLTKQPYLGGNKLSPADILLAVYSRWGAFFPVDIIIGPKVQKMIDTVLTTPAFQLALQQEQEDLQRYEG